MRKDEHIWLRCVSMRTCVSICVTYISICILARWSLARRSLFALKVGRTIERSDRASALVLCFEVRLFSEVNLGFGCGDLRLDGGRSLFI